MLFSITWVNLLPQFIKTKNEEMKISLSVLVIITSVKTIVKVQREDAQPQPPKKKSSHQLHPKPAPPIKAPRGTDHLYPSPRLILAATPPPSIAPKKVLDGSQLGL